nr:immunoglobulin light chain junction region [Macaca mulatta]MOY06294.1 immunoglobulin light chain junction region [Macaca mulatta]MOY07705.1 immunoglobulin light chain junction region [Macaca mulatta]MOY09172.1 immunoglobulin light chain junction region [Macaca mulatta]MOY09473.1 immunoglobulin light chain junction region [Macaca mulatta]
DYYCCSYTTRSTFFF